MTTDAPGLREAAERLFSLPNWENRTGPWKDIHGAIMELRSVYLATHPSDADEPISEEWLREIGWTRVQLRLEMVVDGRTIELYDCVIADSPMRGLLVFFLKKTRKAYTIPLPSTIIAYIIHPSQST